MSCTFIASGIVVCFLCFFLLFVTTVSPIFFSLLLIPKLRHTPSQNVYLIWDKWTNHWIRLIFYVWINFWWFWCLVIIVTMSVIACTVRHRKGIEKKMRQHNMDNQISVVLWLPTCFLKITKCENKFFLNDSTVHVLYNEVHVYTCTCRRPSYKRQPSLDDQFLVSHNLHGWVTWYGLALCFNKSLNSLATDKPVTLRSQIELKFRSVGVVLVFEEGGKPEYPSKNRRSKDENQQQTQPTYGAGSRIQAQATLVGGERSRYCAIPAPPNILWEEMYYMLLSVSEYWLLIVCSCLAVESNSA